VTRRPPPPPKVGYSTRSRIDKLGVKEHMRVSVLGVDDPSFLPELRQRTADVSEGRAGRNRDMIVFGAEREAALARLDALRAAIVPNGAIWVVWPKGQKHITEDTIRRAALARDLVDVKVMAFSERLSALKLVIPVARRPR
jgi:hypothetical protein